MTKSSDINSDFCDGMFSVNIVKLA